MPKPRNYAVFWLSQPEIAISIDHEYPPDAMRAACIDAMRGIVNSIKARPAAYAAALAARLLRECGGPMHQRITLSHEYDSTDRWYYALYNDKAFPTFRVSYRDTTHYDGPFFAWIKTVPKAIRRNPSNIKRQYNKTGNPNSHRYQPVPTEAHQRPEFTHRTDADIPAHLQGIGLKIKDAPTRMRNRIPTKLSRLKRLRGSR